jgi:hypothetical protein
MTWALNPRHAVRPAAGVSAEKRVPASIPEPIELTTQVSGFNQLNHISISETERLRSSGRSVLRLGMTPDNEDIGRASGGQGQRHVGEFAFDRMFSHRSLLGPVALRELLRAPAVAGRPSFAAATKTHGKGRSGEDFKNGDRRPDRPDLLIAALLPVFCPAATLSRQELYCCSCHTYCRRFTDVWTFEMGDDQA